MNMMNYIMNQISFSQVVLHNGICYCNKREFNIYKESYYTNPNQIFLSSFPQDRGFPLFE
jgi:hypothetical protein